MLGIEVCFGLYVCMYVCTYVYVCEYMWQSEDNLQESVLFLHHMSPGIKPSLAGMVASAFTHQAMLTL